MAKHWKTTAKGRTVRQCVASVYKDKFTVPVGTEVIQIDGADWAVKSVKLVAELSGNEHDAEYRFAFVPADVVEVSV